ncbi:hypothetical protein MSG28_007999 [Choristoneura fumiferana]|uniref:Uncharacterized protein n=1 Tax=Choristoneura fumiferana TaxID=7141 RepID=A0ACC0J9Q2_CHOFU|nr:hypothetical protein MSG28_007999 [Choristoneura fumiferana]
MSNTIVQYVLLRSDLLKELGWSVGALVAQACHASTAVLHLYKDDEQTIQYLSDLDNMHKVVLERGRCLLWDATCVSTFALSHLGCTSRSAGAAAENAARFKHLKYSALEPTYHFVPISVETAGPWGAEAKSLVWELSRRLRDRGCDHRSGSYLVQQVALAIQRGNAAGIMDTFEPGTTRNDGF